MDKIDKLISPKWLINQKNNALLKDHSIAIDGNIIKEVLPTSNALKKYQTHNKILLNEHLVIPGLINSHNDSSLIWFGDKYNQEGKLNIKLFNSFKNNHLNQLYKDISSKINIIEMIQNGITTFSESGIFPESVIEQAIKANLRCNIGLEIQKQKTRWAGNENESLDKALRVFDNHNGNPNIHFYFNLVSINNISEKMIQKVSRIANELDIPFRMNINTSESEISKCIKNHKCRPLEYLEKLDILNNRFTALNVLLLNGKDIKLLGKYRSNIVINKNSQLISKNINIKELIMNKVNVTLSTGSILDNSRPDMLKEMSITSMLQNLKGYLVNTKSIFDFATNNASKSIGLEKLIGNISKGYLADLVSINIKDIIQRNSVIFNGIERKLKSENIDNVWISGKQIMKNKKLLTITQEKIYDKFKIIKDRINKNEYR